MGRVLAGILSRSIDEQTNDDRDREAVLVEAATAAGLERPLLDGLLDEATCELPEEGALVRLLEAVAVEDPAGVVAQVRDDGDLIEGDELATVEELQASGRIVEAIGPGTKPGTRQYKVAVIRPGRAKGHGRRYYGTRMLEANAPNFGGQPIFFNHEDLDVILKRGHGSRDPRDLCGWLQEATTWDPTYSEPTDAKNGKRKGAVMGVAELKDDAGDLVDQFPQAVALSVNMDSTRVRVGRTEEGDLAPLVEGVVKSSGSVDLITGEAGAGGKVLERLREAASLRYGSPHADLAEFDADRLVEAVRGRPDVLERLREAPAPPDPNREDDDLMDPEKLIEAVADPDTATRLVEALAASPAFERVVEARVEAGVAEREEAIREDATAESNRLLDLRDFRDEAHRLIEARSTVRGGILTPAFVEDLRARYTLRDGRHPTPALDVHDLVEGDEVKAPARQRLIEAVTADIEREEAKVREASPTRVRDLAPAPPDPAVNNDGTPPTPPEPPKDPLAEELGLDSAKVREHQGVTA